jgi:GTPase SAR1 family protein
MTETSPQDAVPQAGADTARVLPGWVGEARRLAAGYGLDSIDAALRALSRQRVRTVFRIAVVGEFKRGKSTLVNTLIDRALLPTGSLPGKGIEVAVRGVDRAESLRLSFPDGRRLVRDLDAPEAWAGLLAGDGDAWGADAAAVAGGEAGAPTAVAEIRGSWLTGLDLELVDTAGANQGEEEPVEERLRRTITAADAALFVVSAISPLSTTERRLLEEELLCRHLPHLAVAVTMLDRVEPGEREEVLADLRKRLDALPGRGPVPLLPAPAPAAPGPERDRMRALLEDWAREEERGGWRARRLAAETADYCDVMVRLAGEAAAAARLSEQEQRRRALRAEADRAEDEQIWRELRTGLDTRQVDHARNLRGLLLKERTGILEYLREDLSRAADPAAWWERELPAQIRRHLAVTAATAERSVLTRLAADVDWLDAEISRRLPQAAPVPVPDALDLQAHATALDAAQVKDLSRLRLIARVGGQGGSALGYLVAAARRARLPMIYTIGFSVVGGLLAEAAIRTATETQRRQIDGLLVATVDESVAGFADQAAAVLSGLYTDVVDHFQDSHRAWSGARRELLAAASTPADAAHWPDLAVAAAALAARIRGTLERSTTDH